MVKRSVKSINRITIGQINFGTPFMSVSSRHRFLVTRCIRKYATTHTPLKVSFATPSRSILKDSIVGQVDLVTTEGSVGVLANHVPTIFQLSPGVVRFSPASTDLKDSNLLEPHFVSGGFAVINPDSSLDISAMEAVPLSHLDSQAINKALEEVKKRSSTPSKDETESAEVSIHMQVYTALSRAVSN